MLSHSNGGRSFSLLLPWKNHKESMFKSFFCVLYPKKNTQNKQIILTSESKKLSSSSGLCLQWKTFTSCSRSSTEILRGGNSKSWPEGKSWHLLVPSLFVPVCLQYIHNIYIIIEKKQRCVCVFFPLKNTGSYLSCNLPQRKQINLWIKAQCPPVI